MLSESFRLYSVSISSGSDIRHQAQLFSACTHSLFLCGLESVCTISLVVRNLALCLANKRTTSLPEDSETEYYSEARLGPLIGPDFRFLKVA